LKYRQLGSNEPHSVDPDFLEALEDNGSGRASSRRQVERKTQQFCKQVQRALNHALAARSIGGNIEGLYVEELSPAPDCGRLLVHMLVPPGPPLDEVHRALARQTPSLRSEGAAAITRKRAPELSFVPVVDNEGGQNE
jgi:ribosome-binding factor A